VQDIQHRDISLRGLSVHVAEAGEGPPLLLVHGFLVHHGEWLPVLPALAERFRCIAPDLPGFGQSDKRAPGHYPYTREAFAETLDALLEELSIEKAHVAGHSMGGSVALTLAADYPQRVDRLAVVDSACYPFPVPVKGRLPLLPLLGPLIFKRLYGRRLFRDYFANDVWSGHPGVDFAQVDAYYDAFANREAKDAAYETLKNTVDLSSLGPKIPRVKADTLVLWGDEDRIFPPSLAHRLVREIPEARLEMLSGCGHAPNEERPDETAALLLAHFGGASGTPESPA